MLLYHGSHVEVKNPKILTASRAGDFGRGFYTTSNLAQAKRWSQIRAEQENLSVGLVMTYDVPDTILDNSELKVMAFEKADHSWLDFVMLNRKDPNFDHKYDIVTGPVADDRVYACLNAFEEGFMDRATVIRRLKTYVLTDQILFHTAKSLLFLEYNAKEEIPCSRK